MNIAQDERSLRGYLSTHAPAAYEAVARELSGLEADEIRCKLLEMLSDPNHTLRYATTICLGAVGDITVLDALIRTTRDEIGMVRRGACGALGELGDREAVPVLAIATGDVDPLVRETAAEALAKLGAGEKVLRRAGREDPAWPVRRSALEALARVTGTAAIPTLEEALEDTEGRVRERTVELLVALGMVEPAIKVLADDPDPEVRRTAAKALGRSRDKRASHPLLESLAREGFDLRAFMLAALREILGTGLGAFLAEALRSTELGIRRVAVNALAEIGARDTAPRIAELLEDPDRGVRFAAVNALGVLRAPAGLGPLHRLLVGERSDAGLRNAAAHALSQIPGAEPLLEQASRNQHPEVCEPARTALWSMGR